MNLAQEILEPLKASKCWDGRYSLPLFPQYNNPWLYMAYADRVLSKHLIGAIDHNKIRAYFTRCEISARSASTIEPGLFDRWPDGSGGRTSWDEIIGAAYLSSHLAKRIMRHLVKTRGYFNNTNDKPFGHKLKFNVFRLAFLKPWLTARCGVRPDLFSQLIWAGHICLSIKANKKPGDAGGRLRNWIMFEAMREYPVCKRAIKKWKKEMRLAGHTLKNSLAIEPKEPLLVALAPEDWI